VTLVVASDGHQVDVWSCGVIFYEMLFGQKPFGHGVAQSKLFLEGNSMAAKGVQFPSQPRVSAEAKEFIRRCLIVDQEARPEVAALWADPYLRKGGAKE
jgi:tousled-like kinase